MSEGRRRPLFIGLTGSIASGKSTVLAELEKLGVPTLSTDAVVHEIYENDEVIDAVAGRFGPQVLKDGVVDREAVAAEVFAEPEGRVWLEQLIWPRVGECIFEFRRLNDERDPPPAAIVVEVPLLFESGMDQAFDRTVTVTASRQLRMQRADARGTGVSELDAREARHLTAEEKAERADWQIDNDGSIDSLEAQLRTMLDAFAGGAGA